MIGLDTNVLVRYLTQDEPRQAAAATRLIETHCSPEEPGYLHAIVLAELVWVLRGAYGYAHEDVVAVLRRILRTPALAVEQAALCWQAVDDYEQGAADFADCLIAHANHAAGATPTFTFDRKAARSRHFALVG